MQIYPRKSNRSHFWQFIHETAIQVIIHTTGPYCRILQDPTRVHTFKTAAKCLKEPKPMMKIIMMISMILVMMMTMMILEARLSRKGQGPTDLPLYGMRLGKRLPFTPSTNHQPTPSYAAVPCRFCSVPFATVLLPSVLRCANSCRNL